MTEIEIWHHGCAAIAREFNSLTPLQREEIIVDIAALMALKKSMHSQIDKVSGGDRCAVCRGECCKAGRYHVTAIDLLAFLVTDVPVFTPLFAKGWCPFLGGSGCLMAPEYRPFNCIIFNCDQIEELLDPAALQLFYCQEQELRRLYGTIRSRCASDLLRKAVMDIDQELKSDRPGELHAMGHGPGGIGNGCFA